MYVENERIPRDEIPVRVLAWLDDNATKLDFARSLKQQLLHKGWLSTRQVMAADRSLSRVNIDPEDAPEVSTEPLERAFARASEHLKYPGLNVGEYRFTPVKSGVNAGGIYVKRRRSDACPEGEYLGKIMGGKFLARCTREAVDTVLRIAQDPLTAAREHGRITGRCAICSRKLTAEDSTGRGVGPICAAKFGWE